MATRGKGESSLFLKGTSDLCYPAMTPQGSSSHRSR